jgi:hypothetical protein
MPVFNGPTEAAAYLLNDVTRWVFGEVLMKRAGWTGPTPDQVNEAVQAYRLQIMQAVCLAEPEALEPLRLALEAARPSKPVALEGSHADWELALTRQFLDTLEAMAPLGPAFAPMQRFAHGQYFKFSRRVSYLLQRPYVLPCFYAPK